MGNLKEIYKGFLWGCGFAVSTSIIYFIVVSQIAASAQMEYRNSVREMTTTEFNTAAEILLPEILDHHIVNEKVILAVKYSNLIDAGFIGQSFDLHVSLFSSEDKLMGTCSQPLKSLHSTSEFVHTQIECKSVFDKASNFSYAKVDVVVLPGA